MTHSTIPTMTRRFAFARWMIQVERHMIRLGDCTPSDIPEYDYHEDFSEGVSAPAAARSAIRS